ncbi:putative leucine-rich repeat-containing protein DDB_G0290503 [Drosophila takahashii]|uniref:putative leucine-rich repeat-containing protein DDB_G0290503 n=1 Tax=Drosophila takahashii TaxID=29030 RepID=UPI003899289E
MSKKMRSITMESLKKNSENEYLKKELAKTKRELTHLQKNLADQQDKNTETMNRYDQIYEKFAKCEKNYDEQLGIIKACVEKNNKELKLAQIQIVDKDRELKNMQQTNRELAAALSNYKPEIEKLKVTNTEIHERLTGITQAYEDLRVQFDDLTGEKDVCEANILELSTELNAKIIICAELEGRIEELPIEANKAMSKVQSELESYKMRCEEQQRFTDQAEKELELARNEINTLKTLMEEREQCHISLGNENQEIKARMEELVGINENYSKELAETKLKHSQEIKEQANKHGFALRELKDNLKKSSNDFAQLKNSSESLEKKSLQQISQLQGEIKEMQLQRKNQTDQTATLRKELQEKTRNFEARLKGQQEQLSNQVKILTTEFESEAQRSAAEIQTLKAAMEQNDKMYKAQQEKLQSLQTERDKLKDTVGKLEAKEQKIASEFSASKIKFSQELKTQKDDLMKKIFALELDIKNKETRMLELERDKNHEMAVLKFKMNRINSVIDQPINTLPEQPPLKDVSKTQIIPNKRTPEKTDGPSTSLKKRRPRITTIYDSDFASEDDKPISSSYLSGKRTKLSAVVKPQTEDEDLFDRLKKAN